MNRPILGFYEVPEVKVQEMHKRIKITSKTVKGTKPQIVVLQNKTLGLVGLYIEGKHFMIDHMEVRLQELSVEQSKALAVGIKAAEETKSKVGA